MGLGGIHCSFTCLITCASGISDVISYLSGCLLDYSLLGAQFRDITVFKPLTQSLTFKVSFMFFEWHAETFLESVISNIHPSPCVPYEYITSGTAFGVYHWCNMGGAVFSSGSDMQIAMLDVEFLGISCVVLSTN